MKNLRTFKDILLNNLVRDLDNPKTTVIDHGINNYPLDLFSLYKEGRISHYRINDGINDLTSNPYLNFYKYLNGGKRPFTLVYCFDDVLAISLRFNNLKRYKNKE